MQHRAPVLAVSALSGGWADTRVVDSVSLEMAPGECVAITGRNGVRKTTLLELLIGRATRHSGTIHILATDVSAWPAYKRARIGVGHVPQEREVFASLNVEEHLSIARRDGPWTRAAILELFPALERRLGSMGSQLSGGEQQMLAIARALAGNPRLLLMDEPTEGLAPLVAEQLVDALRVVVRKGDLSVLLVEQRIDVALALSTRCLVMDRGRVVHEMTSDMLERDTHLVAELIGLKV